MKDFSTLLVITLSLLPALPGCAPEREGRVLSSDGVAISYRLQGRGEPALVFVHGWCCDKSYWKHQVPHFAKRHKVVTVDLAGHGQSGLGREAWTMEAFGKDVAAVIEKLDLDRVILIGHSLGGPVIIEAARQIPERVIGLVGADTFLDLEKTYTQDQIDVWLSSLRADFAGTTRKLVRGIVVPDTDPALVEWVVTDMCSAPPEVGIGASEAYLSFDAKEALKEVRAPIFCINSDMRPINIEAGRRYARSFEVKLMSGVGHFVMMEDAETFNRLLAETIKQVGQ
ncbi:MAG: alpha/beta fold hydrolase [Planctomycetota bacterium]|jgi:pimeloyl-ACP methyl ester carboxylesterase